jgi:6-phosphogluconolactonase
MITRLPFCLAGLFGLVQPFAGSVGHAAPKDTDPSSFLVYLGTYTGGKSKGIYACRFDAKSGRVSTIDLAVETRNPSWIELHPSGDSLYAVSEIADFQGGRTGAVAAFAVDRATGKLRFLNSVPSKGTGPCHLAVDATGRFVFPANYGSGSVAMLPILEDGKLGEAKAFFQHSGSSVNPRRQTGPHAHGATLSADNRFLFVPDLGLDQIRVYGFDADQGRLTPHDPPYAALAPGAGPRHFVIHPGQEYAYSINELDSTVTIFYYLADRGALSHRQTITTLPIGFSGQNTTAEIVVHPDGRFVYGSNRGDDSIAVFRADRGGGRLRLEQHVPTGGRTPRSFAIDPTGQWLWAANQSTDNIVLFRIDPESGQLTPSGTTLEIGSPVCVKFLAAN